MPIREDSDMILRFIYQEYVEKHHLVGSKDLLWQFKDWGGSRIDRAVKYLRDQGAIDIVLFMGNQNGLQNFMLKRITPIGIDRVEKGGEDYP